MRLFVISPNSYSCRWRYSFSFDELKMTTNIADGNCMQLWSPCLRGSGIQAWLIRVLCSELKSRGRPGLGSHLEFRALFQVHSGVGPLQTLVFLLADAQLLETHTSQYPQSSVAWLFYRFSHLQSVLRRAHQLCQTHPHINSKSPGVTFHPIPRFVCPQGRVFYEVESPGVGILGPSWNLPTTGRNQSACHSNLSPSKGH